MAAEGEKPQLTEEGEKAVVSSSQQIVMAAEGEKPQLNYINEIVLKKRKHNEDWAIRRKQQLQDKVNRNKKNKTDKSSYIKKAEDFIHEFRGRELDHVKMKQRVKQSKHAHLTPASKLLFIVRIGGKSDMHPQIRKLLYSLRLRKNFSGVFVKANERIMQILQRVEPYVTYGYPNLKTVKDLIYKKGSGRVDKQRVPLTDNNIIEQELGKYGILCIEDLVNEVATIGTHFKDVTTFLYPFVLNKPLKTLRGLRKPYKDGGDAGNRDDHINELISKMY